MKKRIYNPIPTICSLLLFGLLLIGIACSSSEEHGGLQIYVFDNENRSNLGSPETAQAVSENNLSVLNSDDLATADIIITEEDILTYNWTIQKIVLSDTFREGYMSEEPFLSPGSVFIASFKGRPLFGGTVLTTSSPFRLETPILYVSPPLLEASGAEGLVVYLRPHSVTFLPEDEESVFPIADHELVEQLREHLQSNGKLID